jgi:CubicO group peptidase (beta-lactamase class C family)
MFAINSAGSKAAARYWSFRAAFVLSLLLLSSVGAAADGKKVTIEKPDDSPRIDERLDIPDISFPCGKDNSKRCRISKFMEDARVCALVAIRNGTIRVMRFNTSTDHTICNEEDEPYEEDGVKKRYRTASVTKSITSTLLAQAIAKKYKVKTQADFKKVLREKTVDAPDLIPALGPKTSKGGYAGVPLERVLQMRSGVKWKEAKRWFSDSDAFAKKVRENPKKTIVEFAQKYKSTGDENSHGPFNYSALDASINGAVAEALLGNKKLTKFLEEGIWAKLGMEAKGRWAVDKNDTAIGECCLNATVRDLARFGMFVLAKGMARGNVELVPAAWFDLATKHGTKGEDEIPVGNPSHNEGCPLDYRYQWWLRKSPSTDFTAIGISGQFVHIYPADNAVIVQISDWKKWDDRLECESLKAHDALVAAMK